MMETLSDYSIFSRKAGVRPFQLFRVDMKALYIENYPEDTLSTEDFTDLAVFIWQAYAQIKTFYRLGTAQSSAKGYLIKRKSLVRYCDNILQRHSPGRVICALKHDGAYAREKLSSEEELAFCFIQSINLWRASRELPMQDPATDYLCNLFPSFLFEALNVPTVARSLKERKACLIIKELESMFTKHPSISPVTGMEEEWD